MTFQFNHHVSKCSGSPLTAKSFFVFGTDGGVVGHDIRLNSQPRQILQLTQGQLPQPGHFKDLCAVHGPELGTVDGFKLQRFLMVWKRC